MRRGGRAKRALVAYVAVSWLVAAAAAEPRSVSGTNNRPYADGPLTAADFSGKRPAQSPVNMGIEMVANTECEVRYEYRSTVEQKGQNPWTARMSSFECTAVIVPEKCWNAQPESRRILDHEQGHFDLAEIAARRAQQHFSGLARDGKAIARVGTDEPPSANWMPKSRNPWRRSTIRSARHRRPTIRRRVTARPLSLNGVIVNGSARNLRSGASGNECFCRRYARCDEPGSGCSGLLSLDSRRCFVNLPCPSKLNHASSLDRRSGAVV
jgi:hypothetical protein